MNYSGISYKEVGNNRWKDMRRDWFKYLSILFSGIVVVFSGCSRDVQTSKMGVKDMSGYATFAWLPADTTMNDFAKDSTVAEAIRDKVTDEMKSVGYEIDTESPDLLVMVHTQYDEEIDYETTVPAGYSYYYGPSFYSGPWEGYYYTDYYDYGPIGAEPGIQATTYTKGTIIIDLIDTKSKNIIWRGTASDPVYDQDEVVEEMVDNVDEIFEEFPS